MLGVWCSAQYCGAAFFYIVARLYLIDKKAKVLLICNSQKAAKTDLYNERKRGKQRRGGNRKGGV